MNLTIAYMTSRREPRIEWFFDSFHRECRGNYGGIKLVVVDFWADYPGRRELISDKAHHAITHVPPKPTVWQGEHKLTSVDYFAASNARNTALCLAPNGWIVYVDDLSVLMPGWLVEVRNAVHANYIACGAYEKVLGLEVKDGVVIGYREFPPGKDSRSKIAFGNNPLPCRGQWLFGASAAIPVEGLLTINGWDEDADSMSGEDYICGMMLEKSGYPLRYCPGMKTLESEELHYAEPPFKRIIKPGNPDASHRLLRLVQGGRKIAPNYVEGGMRALRDRVLFHNEPFPITGIPDRDWRDGQLLKEM